jgi:histidine triad (HIT) family protein
MNQADQFLKGTNMSCVFCDVWEGKSAARIIFRDDDVLAFHDIHPQAPTHILIIPKKHIRTINDLALPDSPLLSKLILTAKELAVKLHFAEQGYRLVLNCNNDGGQTIYHIHLHLLAGRTMGWPPG